MLNCFISKKLGNCEKNFIVIISTQASPDFHHFVLGLNTDQCGYFIDLIMMKLLPLVLPLANHIELPEKMQDNQLNWNFL